jgi:hypothetical protein
MKTIKYLSIVLLFAIVACNQTLSKGAPAEYLITTFN